MSSPPTSFSMDNRIFRTFCCCMQFCIRSRLNNSTIFEFFLWVIRNCHCFEWRDTNIFPRDCRFLSIFYSFLHVRFVHKGLRSWFLFSFFFNVNRWHFIFLSSSFHTQCVCVFALYNCLEAIFSWMAKVWTMNVDHIVVFFVCVFRKIAFQKKKSCVPSFNISGVVQR